MRNRRYLDVMTIGFALFAMFFGAGNLILPPKIGLDTGGDWFNAVSGFSITAILAPFLGILAVLFSGEDFTDLAKRINEKLGWILATVIILSIGPLVAIPRTAATTYEVGILSIWPDFNPIVSSVLFFGITLLLSISPSKVVDIIGKYLTPLLLLLLFFMVIVGIVNPLDTTALETVNNPNAFKIGFLEGYQTMDVLASVIYAGIIILAVKSKGYTNLREKIKVTFLSGAVAILCMLFIYGGLTYLGSTSGYAVTDNVRRTDLLLSISNGLLGATGTAALALCIALACLTTAIALVCATGTFFAHLTNGKLSYRFVVIITCVFSAILAVKGVDSIIAYAGPLLEFIYPITLTLILYMVVFGRLVKRKLPFVLAICTTTVISFLFFTVSIGHIFGLAKYGIIMKGFLSMLPLNDYDVPWLIPSFIAFAVTYIVQRLAGKNVKEA